MCANGHVGLVRLLLSRGTTNVASNGSGNPRLDELKVEKEELDEYQRLDRERRAVEYTLYNKELRRVRKGLDEVEHARKDEADRLSSHEEVREVQERILSVEAEEKAKGNALKRNAVYVRGLKNDKELRRAREGLEEVEHARNEQGDRLSSLQTFVFAAAKNQQIHVISRAGLMSTKPNNRKTIRRQWRQRQRGGGGRGGASDEGAADATTTTTFDRVAGRIVRSTRIDDDDDN